MDELVDVVDENDVVIGQKMKSECHVKGLLHRWATVLCFRNEDKKEILVNKRSLKKKTSPAKFCFPWWHLQTGDSYEDWARREFLEEMFSVFDDNISENLWDWKLKMLFKFYKNSGDHEFHTVFEAIYDWKFDIDLEEVESWFWMDINKLTEDIRENPEKYTRSTAMIWEKYSSGLV